MVNKIFSAALFLLFLTTFAQHSDGVNKRKLLSKQYKKYELNLKKQHKIESAAGIPPNEYNEQDFKNTMDPKTGQPNFPSLISVREDLLAGKFAPQAQLGLIGNTGKTDGRTIINQPWVERGPYNVGGRTRAIRFDPNDPTGKKVLAGGISGGLWSNADLSNPSNEWKPLSQFWSNTSVSSIAFDPNNTQIIYVGTGEAETNDVIGSGIWKSTDDGKTWTNIFTIPVTYDSNGYRSGIFYVNDIKVRNNNGVSEVYAGVSGGYTGTFNGLSNAGVYKSTNGGATFIKNTSFNAGAGIAHSIQQIEIAQDNSIWVSTRTGYYGNVPSGGKVFRSTDGVTFTNIYNANLPGSRVNFCLSKTNPAKAYILMQGAGASEPVRILKTLNTGATWASSNVAGSGVTLPVDADTGIPNNDFTRGQNFYDLIILADPTNDDSVYVGGIDLFNSADGAGSWAQISKWSNNNNLFDLSLSLVHADQHTLIFNPNNSNQMISGNDGGIYFVPDKNNAASVGGFVMSNTRYNVTQFYHATLNPIAVPSSEEFLAGAQDNGTQKFTGAPLTNNFYNSVMSDGGDGGFNEYDDNAKYNISSYTNNNYFLRVNGSRNPSFIFPDKIDNSLGHFINEMTVDRNKDIFYSYRVGLTINKVTGLLSSPQVLVRTQISAGTPSTNEEVSALKVSPYTTASSTLFVGSNLGTLYKITNADSGAPTSSIVSSQLGGSISDISFGTSESQILVTIYNYGADTVNVFYSNDGGVSFQNKEGNLPDMPVRAILMNPEKTSEVIIGTEMGVWGTANFMDASPTWAQYAGDMGNVRVSDLDYRPATKTILAATFGRGAWTNTNAVELGTSETNNANGIKIYPNPSKGNVSLKYDSVKFRNVTVTVYDASGKLVFTKTNISSDQEFQTGLIKGFYVLKASNGSDTIFTTSLLIN